MKKIGFFWEFPPNKAIRAVKRPKRCTKYYKVRNHTAQMRYEMVQIRGNRAVLVSIGTPGLPKIRIEIFSDRRPAPPKMAIACSCIAIAEFSAFSTKKNVTGY